MLQNMQGKQVVLVEIVVSTPPDITEIQILGYITKHEKTGNSKMICVTFVIGLIQLRYILKCEVKPPTINNQIVSYSSGFFSSSSNKSEKGRVFPFSIFRAFIIANLICSNDYISC